MAGPINVSVDYTRYMQFDRKVVRSAMRKAAATVKKEAKRLAGRKQMSLPGQPPGRDSGALFQSAYGRGSRRGYAMVAGTTSPHAHLVELGTKHMQPRPLMPVALANKRDAVIGLLEAAIGPGLFAVDGSATQAPPKVETG
jgi:Bacteriophage HK97-gp10, putative tail-component